ncbi:MAG: type IV pilus biogenesis/stability protein PilW [Burkholderiaceae bacterium]|jgi:type IV pilus assembly protein PilF|nr:type IV pilus biogenesis/stability protein PilW [Burkholderiaceae bacterium]
MTFDHSPLRRALKSVCFGLTCAATAAAGAFALLGLAGCTTPGGYAGELPSELHTAQDDSQARRHARTRLALASAYYEGGKTIVALDELKKAMQIDPSFGDAYNLGGLIYMRLNDMARAESHFERAVSINPGDGNAWHNLGWLRCQQEKYPAAAQAFQRAAAIPTYPDKARTLLAEGVCESRAGDRAAAEASLKRAYALDPGHPVIAYNLAKLIYLRGDAASARFYLQRLNSSEYANAETLWLGIQVENKLNNPQAMQQLAAQLRKDFPDSGEIRLYDRKAFDE